jgi:hypothetical protein
MSRKKQPSPLVGEQLVIPLESDLTFVVGAKKKAFAGTPSSDLYRPLIEKIRVVEGFNPRINTKKYREKIEWLARKIAREGYDATQTMVVWLVREGNEDIPCLHDGHRRLEAVFLANEYRAQEGKPRIDRVPVTIIDEPESKSLNAALIHRNDKEKLTLLEKAIVAYRLHKDGLSVDDICDQLEDSQGRPSDVHVKGMLLLAGADRRIQVMVAEDKITATTAIDVLRKHKDGALEYLLKTTEGKDHVRPRDLPGALVKRVTKKIAPKLVGAMKEIETDPAFGQLSETTRATIKDLLDKLREAEEKDRPAADDPPAEGDGKTSE